MANRKPIHLLYVYNIYNIIRYINTLLRGLHTLMCGGGA